MKAVASDKVLSGALRKLPEEMCNRKDINGLALQLFAGTQNFTLLHGFTSSHALMVLEPFLKDVQTAYQYHYLHLQIAYLSTGCVEITTVDPRAAVRGWHEILKRPFNLKTPTPIKLFIVYTSAIGPLKRHLGLICMFMLQTKDLRQNLFKK